MDFIACQKDGFPTIVIDGKRRCVAEYIERCIRDATITDVVERENKALFYIFENGHELPLLCAGCNGDIKVNNLAKEKNEIIGRHLLATRWQHADYGDEGEVIELFLQLGKYEGRQLDILEVNTSLNSANRLVHPENCILKNKDLDDLHKRTKKPKQKKKKRKRHKRKK